MMRTFSNSTRKYCSLACPRIEQGDIMAAETIDREMTPTPANESVRGRAWTPPRCNQIPPVCTYIWYFENKY